MSSDNAQPVLDYATPSAKAIKHGRGLWGWVLFVVIAVMLFMVVQHNGGNYSPIPLSLFRQELQAGRIAKITIANDGVVGIFSGNGVMYQAKTVKYFRTYGPTDAAGNWAFIEYIFDNSSGAEIEIDPNSNFLLQFLLPLIPWLLIFGFIWFFVLRNLRKTQGAAPKPIPVYQVAPPVQRAGSVQ